MTLEFIKDSTIGQEHVSGSKPFSTSKIVTARNGWALEVFQGTNISEMHTGIHKKRFQNQVTIISQAIAIQPSNFGSEPTTQRALNLW